MSNEISSILTEAAVMVEYPSPREAEMVGFNQLYQAVYSHARKSRDWRTNPHAITARALTVLRDCVDLHEHEARVLGTNAPRTVRAALDLWLKSQMPAEVAVALRNAARVAGRQNGTTR